MTVTIQRFYFKAGTLILTQHLLSQYYRIKHILLEVIDVLTGTINS